MKLILNERYLSARRRIEKIANFLNEVKKKRREFFFFILILLGGTSAIITSLAQLRLSLVLVFLNIGILAVGYIIFYMTRKFLHEEISCRHNDVLLMLEEETIIEDIQLVEELYNEKIEKDGRMGSACIATIQKIQDHKNTLILFMNKKY